MPRIQPYLTASTAPWPRTTPCTPGTSAPSALGSLLLPLPTSVFCSCGQSSSGWDMECYLELPLCPEKMSTFHSWARVGPPQDSLSLMPLQTLRLLLSLLEPVALWFPLLETPPPHTPTLGRHLCALVLSLLCSVLTFHLIRAAFPDHPKENKPLHVFQPHTSQTNTSPNLPHPTPLSWFPPSTACAASSDHVQRRQKEVAKC